jgi:hypothetical protein
MSEELFYLSVMGNNVGESITRNFLTNLNIDNNKYKHAYVSLNTFNTATIGNYQYCDVSLKNLYNTMQIINSNIDS